MPTAPGQTVNPKGGEAAIKECMKSGTANMLFVTRALTFAEQYMVRTDIMVQKPKTPESLADVIIREVKNLKSVV